MQNFFTAIRSQLIGVSSRIQFPYLDNSLFSLVVSVTILVAAYFILEKIDQRRHSVWNFLKHHLLIFFIIVWIMGFVCYYVGITYAMGDDVTLLTATPMAILCAFGMFLSQSDVSLVQEGFHKSSVWMALFSVSHFAAVCLSLLFVIKHFGNYFKFVILRWYYCLPHIKPSEELCIFWGLSQGAVLLANDILSQNDSRKRVVLIHTTDDTEEEHVRMGITRLFNMITLKNDKLQQLQEKGCLVFNCFNHLSKLDISQQPGNRGKLDLLETILDLHSLVNLMEKTSSVENGKIHFFFLGEDTKANANAVNNLLNDKIIQKYPSKAEIYCMVTHEEVEMWRSVFLQDNLEAKVNIIDRSSLSMLQLKSPLEKTSSEDKIAPYYSPDHPVQYMDIDPEHACAISSFNALIIGFGETGKEALSFLYEFSAVPDKDGNKNPTHIVVVDTKMDAMRGQFYELHPAFCNDLSEIELVQADTETENFVTLTLHELPKLDYVVISLGNDELNIDVATRLFNLAYRYRENIQSKLGIYARCNNMENYQLMTRVFGKLNESAQSNGKEDFIQLHVFGAPQEIFRYSLIVENTPLIEAKLFNWEYAKVCNSQNARPNALEQWTEDFNLKNKIEKYGIKTAQQVIYRTVQQNMSNSLHIATKLKLLGLSGKDSNADASILHTLLQVVDGRKSETTEYRQLSDSNGELSEWHERLTNLAICEHLRWEASHKMLGYVYGPEKNERTKTLDCLCPWHEINVSKESYDCAVVDTSIRIVSEKLKFD